MKNVLIFLLVLAVLASILFYLFPFNKVVGNSMSPTFPNGSFVISERISYFVRIPEEGEVVLYHPPGDTNSTFIGRIIMTPSNRVKFEKGNIFVNNYQLTDESYLSAGTRTNTWPNGALKEGVEYVIPPDQYLILSDNRDHGYDSRLLGFVPISSIIGDVFYIHKP